MVFDPRDPRQGEWEGTSAERIMHALMRLSRLQFRMMQSIQEKLGLYPGQPQLMMYLAQHEDAPQLPSQRELAHFLHIRPATLTVTLGRMEAAGLILRHHDPVDGRIQRVALTGKGKEVTRQFKESLRQSAQALFAPLGEEQMEALLSTLDRLNRHLASQFIPNHAQEDLRP